MFLIHEVANAIHGLQRNLLDEVARSTHVTFLYAFVDFIKRKMTKDVRAI